MGEAKRRKNQGLPPKGPKKSPKKFDSSGLLARYPRLPLYLIGVFIIVLIVDLIKELG